MNEAGAPSVAADAAEVPPVVADAAEVAVNGAVEAPEASGDALAASKKAPGTEEKEKKAGSELTREQLLEFVKKQRAKLKRQEKENIKLKQDAAAAAEKAIEEAKTSNSSSVDNEMNTQVSGETKTRRFSDSTMAVCVAGDVSEGATGFERCTDRRTERGSSG